MMEKKEREKNWSAKQRQLGVYTLTAIPNLGRGER